VAVLVAVALSLALQWHLARLRPHLWTLLFTAILTDGYLARPRPPGVKGWIGFAALILTWGNSHAAAVIAPALLAAGCAGAWLARDAVRARGLALLTAGGAALLLVNPYGAGVYIYAFDTQALAEWIPEWKPLASLAADPLQLAQQSYASDFRPQILAVGALAAVCVPLALWVLWTARRQGLTALPEGCDAALAAVAAPLACLPFTANRHDLFLPVPVFFAAATLSSLRGHSPKLRSAATAAGWLAVLVAAAMLVKDTLYRAQRYAEAGLGLFSDVFTPHSPAGAAAFVKAAGLEGCCDLRRIDLP
jgi:hypothetical protein